ncbi:PLP-dependent aminotransferase family protein [Pseudomonas nabeulensis]|nr:PLP-dependent aminotransferase family protein [Pseudomonas nabeulensis]
MTPTLNRTGKHDLMWRQLLPKARRNDEPLQVQLCVAFVTAILDGRLPAGTRLPSGRDLAQLTGVSRNTAVLVYERLSAEGYIESRLRDGFFVCSDISPTQATQEPLPAPSAQPDWQQRLKATAHMAPWADRPTVWRRVRYPFIYGQFDPRQFPLTQWRQCTRQANEVKAVDRWWQEGEDAGNAQLIDQLIRRVLPRRGIAATRDQVLLTLGRQQSFYLLARLLVRDGARIGFEEPGYMDPRNVFAYNGAQVVPLPVDEQGVVPTADYASCDYLYCTPGYQCPTGVTLSPQRRTTLLAMAAQHDQVIIEDDDDPETEYDGQALPALKAQDGNERVIYLSSLSKLLSPGLGIGYIVAPAPVIEQLRHLQRLMIRQIPGNNQVAAALFIQQGHYDRLLQQAREKLAQRAALITQALRAHLPEATFIAPTGGATLWLRLPHCHDLTQLYMEGLAQGVLFDPSSAFYMDPAVGAANPAMRLGFGSMAKDTIVPGIEALSRVIHAHWQRWKR